ncbi:hypothetical protein ACFL5F_00410 [Planctomycetota bacterium]
MSKAKSVKKSDDKNRKRSSNQKASKSAAKKAPAVCEDTMQENSGIPKFDLAEQIMAEHRKITAIRRKGPAKKANPPKKLHPAEFINRNDKPRSIVSEPGQIIAEIVARDIEKLCMGNIP